ncbi:hypothetical protein, partial [Pararhodobacter sp. SW119]|uniref:hypothetical protein n=1 Tax=Pararhodobacter sp. SW119 TaxID=2780075 RepID=UPI001AE0326E
MFNRQPPAEAWSMPFAILLDTAMEVGLGLPDDEGARWKGPTYLAAKSQVIKQGKSGQNDWQPVSHSAIKAWKEGRGCPEHTGPAFAELLRIFCISEHTIPESREQYSQAWRRVFERASKRDHMRNKAARQDEIKQWRKRRELEGDEFRLPMQELTQIEQMNFEVIQRQAREEGIHPSTGANLIGDQEYARRQAELQKFLDSGDYEAALRKRREIVDYASDLEEANKARALLYIADRARLAAMEHERGLYFDAKDTYRRVLETLPFGEKDLRETYSASYRAALNSAALRCGRFSEAESILRESEELGIDLNLKAYGILSRKSEDLPQAQKVLDEVTAKGIVPNSFIFTPIIRHCKSFGEARTFFDLSPVSARNNFLFNA